MQHYFIIVPWMIIIDKKLLPPRKLLIESYQIFFA